MSDTVQDTGFFRVEFVNGFARVDQYEISGDIPTIDRYYEVNDLPDWIQKRVAVLSIMSYTPPTEIIPNVGRRISKYIYWVFPPVKEQVNEN